MISYQGSCVAVYSSRSYPSVISAIKNLQAVHFSNNQLTVMGKRATLTSKKSIFLNLIKSFYFEKREQSFWENLSELLRGQNYLKISKDYYIKVTGELSKVNFKNIQNEANKDSVVEITSLLDFVGIPEVSCEYYKTVLKKGLLLLIIHGDYEELKHASNLLDLSGNINVSLHLTNTC